MIENIKNAGRIKEALQAFSENPQNVDNFIFYLEQHFDTWMQKYANTPEKLADEFYIFSTMDI